MGVRRTREEKIGKLLGEDAQYVPLASEIGKRVTEELARADQREVSEAYRRAIADAEQQERRRQVTALFGELPAERRFAILLDHFGDEELRDAIAVHRESIVKRDRQQAVVQELQEQGAREHRVDLSRIPADMTLEADLYYVTPGKRRITERFDPDYGYLARSLQFGSVGDSNFMVVKDEAGRWGSAVRKAPEPELDRYDIVELGSTVNLAEGEPFSRHAYYGSPLATIEGGVAHEFRCDLQDGIERDRELVVLGGLSLNGTALLGEFLD